MTCSNGGQTHQEDISLCSPFSYAHLKHPGAMPHHHCHQQPMAAGDEPSPSPSPPLSSVNSSSSSSSSVPLPAAAASPASSREFLPALFARLLHARSANTTSIQHSILDRSCSAGSDVLSLNNTGSSDLALASSSCSSSCAAGCCCAGGSGSGCAAAAAAGTGCSSLLERRVSRLAPVSVVPSARSPAQPLGLAEAQPRTSKHADEAAAEQDAPPSPSSLAAAVKCFVRMAGPNHGRNDAHGSNSSLKAKSGKKLQLSRSMVQLRSGPAGEAGDTGGGEDGDAKGGPMEPEVFVRRMESSSPTRIKGVRCIGISKSQQLLPKSQQLCGSDAVPEMLATSTGPVTGTQDRLSSSSSSSSNSNNSDKRCQKHCQQASSAASSPGTVVSCDAAAALRLTVSSSRTGGLADDQQQQQQTAREAAVAKRVCETPASNPSKPASPKSPKLLSKSAFTACANAIAAAAAASVRWAELPQRTKQQKQQRKQEQQPQQQPPPPQQQQQLAAGVASFTGTASSMTAGFCALEGSSSSCISSSSFSSSFRPHPPAGSSPQKQRPGVLLRQASAASATAAAAAGHKSTSVGSPPAAAAAGAGSPLIKAAAGAASSGSCSSAAGAAAGSGVSSGTGNGGRAPAVAGGCTPIAVARHCPRDINGQQWQPSQFVQTRRLYEGKIALVLQGYHAPSGRPLALKVYNRSKLDTMERFQLAREVCLHMRSCHPYIASLYAAYKDTAHIYLLMELAPSGNLYQMLMALKVPVGGARRLGEREAVVHVIAPLLSALCYLHDQGIIHRDIKLENVLLTADGCIKLADFGLSIDSRHEVANTRLGTQGYFAPEVLVLPLKSSPFEGKSPAEAAARPSYDCKVDVWSAGVVCYEVLTGRAPFSAETVAKVVEAIMYRKLAYPAHLSSQAVSFLAAALTRNPKLRPTARQLLHHPFIAAFTGGAAAGAAGVLRE